MENDVITIEVAFASSENQSLIELQVQRGTTLIEAIKLSGIEDKFPKDNLHQARKGIFGKFADDDRVLVNHDRVEIYRPLVVDPREARRRRARKDTKN